jgi:hypothetical protein
MTIAELIARFVITTLTISTSMLFMKSLLVYISEKHNLEHMRLRKQRDKLIRKTSTFFALTVFNILIYVMIHTNNLI